MEMLWSNGPSCPRSKHAYDYYCWNCLIFFFFLYYFLELGFHLFPLSWYVVRFGIFVTLLSGHFSIMLRLTLIVIMEKFLVFMKIIIWKMMDDFFICASWKCIGSFQNLLYSWVFQVQNKLHEASFYVGECKNKWTNGLQEIMVFEIQHKGFFMGWNELQRFSIYSLDIFSI
jgi:hypothetical protein